MQTHVPNRSLLIHTEADVYILKGEGFIGNFYQILGGRGEREEIRREVKIRRKFKNKMK